MAPPRGLVVVSAVVALGLLGSACGADAPRGESSAAAEEPEADTGSAAASVDDLASVPDLEVTEVATGRSTTLAAELASDGRPVVAWFWAPNCPTCRSEAPELDAFVEEHGSEVKLVGVGTRDDPDLAEEFLEVTGVERFPLLWEPTGEAWSTFGVTAQPYTVLYDAGGAELQRWPGGASGEEILEELDRSA